MLCTGDGDRDAEADAEALDAVENLLESYFVQIDGTFDKLEALGAHCLALHQQPARALAGCLKQQERQKPQCLACGLCLLVACLVACL